MAREMTFGELASIRSERQFSKVYMAIHNPAVVFSCRVNQAFTTKDKVVEITYDAGVGAFADILPGMTVWVGSSAGAWDKGQVRARKAASSTVLYVGENSEVKWADNLYITVVDEFGLWAKHPRVLSSGDSFMDYDVAYVDQHSAFAPVPVMGTHHCLWLTGATVSVDLDAGDSWCPAPGVKSYAWSATGGVLADETTATPTFTASAAGTYRVDCEVTVDGVSTIGRRYIFVFDAENRPFLPSIKSEPRGSYDQGGWDFTVGVVGDASQLVIRDRALVVLFSVDFYGGIETSLGPIPGSENIKLVGYIAGESINVNPVESTVAFEVKGPHAVLETIEEFIDGVEDTTGTPAAWTSIHNLTLDKCLWHLITWRSTTSTVMDVYPTGDSRQALALQSGEGSLMSQINDNASAIAAKACCDRFGRMFIEVNLQLIPEADRTAVPEVLTLTQKDWTGAVSITRNVVDKTSQVILSGVHYETGTEGSALFSLSPGHVFRRYGSTISIERLLLQDQASANELAGLVLGWNNHEFDLEINVASNNGMVDIAPNQYVRLDISAADNSRGLTFAGRMVPREITMRLDSKTSFLSYTWVGESESFAENSVNGDVPSESADDWDSSMPSLPALPPLPALPVIYPPASTLPANQPKVVIGSSKTHGVFYTKDFDAASPTWYLMNGGLTDYWKTEIDQLIVTPSGACYIMTDGDEDIGWGRVMRCAGVGGVWETVFLPTTFSPTARVTGLGFNPNVSDQVAIVAGDEFIPFGDTNTARIYIGSGSSFTAGGYLAAKYAKFQKAVVFWKNNWIVAGHNMDGIGGGGAKPLAWRFTAGGTLIPVVWEWGSGPGATIGNCHACAGVNLVLWGCNVTDDYVVITDLAGTTTHVTTGPHATSLQAIAASPTSVKAIACDTDIYTTPYKSTDSLTTWSSLAAVVPVGSDVWECCRNDYMYIFGGGIVVKLTMDMGTTVPIDKAGNLLSIAALIDINILRFIQ